ncbi:tRNA pseudouridine synthase [Dorcoceras hygrometricum]|uniref:tRNA pseudouridine synthase n=1 Tax=Dorcoceras hygrometricum TaxID=472368 RepID=A0A2Z7D966_9LAMI|nr:tRNA pseudouridine synthase [Dorcoceras hygrometricum]
MEPEELEFDRLLNCFPRGLNLWRFEEKSDIVGIMMSPSVFSVAGVGTSSFGLVGTTTFGISGRDSVVSCVRFQLCERSDVALLSDVHGTPLAETLRFDIAFGRFLEAGDVRKDISLL